MDRKKLQRHTIIFVAIIVMWLQTYVTYRTSFKLDLENFMQEIILFISPLAFLMFVYGIALFFKTSKVRNRYIVVISLFLTILQYGNVVFYRFYSDFITLPVLFQTNNFGDLGNSVTTLINWSDIFYFTGLILILVAMKVLPHATTRFEVNQPLRRTYFVFSLAVLLLNLGLAEIERPQLLTRGFDRSILVKNLGAYNYHLYDAFVQSKSHAQRAMANGSELTDVMNYVNANQTTPNKDYYGIAKDRNVIIISLESMQDFVINNKVNGQTITPFLNSLTKDKDTLYYDNFYHQTGLGKTSDAEFIVENSMFGTGRGAVFFTNSGNTYHSMAEQMNQAGYQTSVMHSNNKSFWNRDLMYDALNIKKFYDVESFNVTEQNSANWGLKDIPFMEQSVELMKDIKQPFYTRLLSLSNHFPFISDDEDQFIKPYDSGDKTVDGYFQTVNYTDEAIKVLFQKLKDAGLYDNSIIVMYGDHYGISENHNSAMAKYLDKESITPFDSTKLQQVPFFIHAPGSDLGEKAGSTKHEVSGEIDIRPTLLHLLGIDTSHDLQFGSDLLSKDHENFTILRDGRFITDQYVYTSETCYDTKTGKPTKDANACQPYIKRANEKLEMSDRIINGDLMRFYNHETGQVKE